MNLPATANTVICAVPTDFLPLDSVKQKTVTDLDINGSKIRLQISNGNLVAYNYASSVYTNGNEIVGMTYFI